MGPENTIKSNTGNIIEITIENKNKKADALSVAVEGKDSKKTHFGYETVSEREKQGRVNAVFTSVAEKYDLMNDLMSLGTHRLWKRYVASKTNLKPGQSALDVAGGTADIGMLMGTKTGPDGNVVIYDISPEMLLIGRDRTIDRGFVKGFQFVCGNAEAISFADNTFHCVTVGFGIRNVTHLDRAFSEMVRVAKPGARVICLEFSHVKSKTLKKLYDLYSFSFIPAVGQAVTGNRDAYQYLSESIRKFPNQVRLKKIMEDAGLFNVKYYNLFNGIAAVHVGTKV